MTAIDLTFPLRHRWSADKHGSQQPVVAERQRNGTPDVSAVAGETLPENALRRLLRITEQALQLPVAKRLRSTLKEVRPSPPKPALR